MGGDVDLMHDSIGDIVVCHGLMVFREMHSADRCVDEGVRRLNSRSSCDGGVGVDM